MSSNKTIYTSGPLSQNRRTSQQFSTYQASGAPIAVSEARISMFNTSVPQMLSSVFAVLWAFVAASIGNVRQSLKGDYTLPPTTNSFDFIPRPGLIVTVQKKLSEAKKAGLIAAGFAEQTNGRYQYFRGPPTDLAMKSAIETGCVTDAFAPGNNVSVNGLIAFSLFNRLLTHVFAFIASSNSAMFSSDFTEAKPITPSTNWKIKESNLSELPEKGFFFGYFDGLTLPDRAIGPRVFSKYFTGLLGKNAQKVRTLEALHSGWTSLADTASGRMISHMMFCLDLALPLGIIVRPVFLNDEYCGMVFYTSTAGVVVGSTTHMPRSQSEMKADIEFMQSHDSALTSIAEIISELPLRVDEETTATVLPSSLEYPRDIHNKLRERKVGPDEQRQLSSLVKKLRFKQDMWEVTSPRQVMLTIVMITKGDFPERQVPFNLFIDALWTTSPIYSVLAAYAVRAPSLRGMETTLTRRVAKEMYSFSKPGKLTGIPIFAKPHYTAKEDWEGVLQQLQVWFGHKNADKNGILRVKALTMSIPFDTDEGKTAMNAIVLIAKKRARADEGPEGEPGPTEEELERQAAAKRRKLKGYGLIGLNFDLPGQSLTAMEVDEEEDPFAL